MSDVARQQSILRLATEIQDGWRDFCGGQIGEKGALHIAQRLVRLGLVAPPEAVTGSVAGATIIVEATGFMLPEPQPATPRPAAPTEELAALTQWLVALVYLWTRDSEAPDANEETALRLLTVRPQIFSDKEREAMARRVVAAALDRARQQEPKS